MTTFVVTLKGGVVRRIKANDLREAQDKALGIFGAWIVIEVRESREHPDPEHVYAQGKP